jgi:hypothetical protein
MPPLIAGVGQLQKKMSLVCLCITAWTGAKNTKTGSRCTDTYSSKGAGFPIPIPAAKGKAMSEWQKLPSQHQVGDRAYFQPVIGKIDGRTMLSDDSAIPVLVVGVAFDGGKVLYDIALPNGEGGFYEVHPLRGVDSYFMAPPVA